jgi:hypothetical protein
MIRLVSNELERIQKEAVIASFKALSQHLPGRLKEIHVKLQSE